MKYVKLRSWHRLVTFTRNGGAITRCGRRVQPADFSLGIVTAVDDLPLGERSCESCLRLAAHDEDVAE